MLLRFAAARSGLSLVSKEHQLLVHHRSSARSRESSKYILLLGVKQDQQHQRFVTRTHMLTHPVPHLEPLRLLSMLSLYRR